MELRKTYAGTIYAVIDGTSHFGLTLDAINRRDGPIARLAAEWLDAGNNITDDESPAATIAQVKAEAGRRIEASYPLWKQLTIMRSGDGLAAMATFIDAVRAASNALEATLPTDYQADAHWPAT